MVRKQSTPRRICWLICESLCSGGSLDPRFCGTGGTCPDRVGSLCRTPEEDDVLAFLGNLKRTHYCGELRAKDEKRDPIVMGGAPRARDHGNLPFPDILDRTAIAACLFINE